MHAHNARGQTEYSIFNQAAMISTVIFNPMAPHIVHAENNKPPGQAALAEKATNAVLAVARGEA